MIERSIEELRPSACASDHAANSAFVTTITVTATIPAPVPPAVAAAISAAPASISMIAIIILLMIAKTMRETEMISTTATILKMMIIERIIMRKTKKRRINVTMRTARSVLSRDY